jgi:hypothetical protein
MILLRILSCHAIVLRSIEYLLMQESTNNHTHQRKIYGTSLDLLCGKVSFSL